MRDGHWWQQINFWKFIVDKGFRDRQSAKVVIKRFGSNPSTYRCHRDSMSTTFIIAIQNLGMTFEFHHNRDKGNS